MAVVPPTNDFWKKKIAFYFNDILDTNSDGKINTADISNFKEMYKIMKGLKQDSPQLTSFCEFLDKWMHAITDFRKRTGGAAPAPAEPGKPSTEDDISLDDFSKYCEDLRLQLLKENNWPVSSHMREYVSALFTILDSNNDGFIDRNDFLANSTSQDDFVSRQAGWKIIAKSEDFKLNKDAFDSLCKEFVVSINSVDPGNWIFGVFQ
jgi:hypothetical protein